MTPDPEVILFPTSDYAVPRCSRSAESRLHWPKQRCGIQAGGFQQGRQAQSAGCPVNRLVGMRRLGKCHFGQGQWRLWVAPTFKPCAEVVNWRSSQETL